MKKILFLLITFLSCNFVFSATWSEPWQREIFQKSDFFILGQIVSSTPEKLNVVVVKSFGNPLNGKIEIENYFLLKLCSSSGNNDHELDLPLFEENDFCYFYLKKNANNTFSLPTPTSGFAFTQDNKVKATYRNSFIPVIVSQSDYELTSQAIFDHYHDRKYEKDKILEFILEYLSKKPVEMKEENADIIMNQHAALETIYHLGLNVDFSLIYPFLEVNHYNYNISAARSLKALKSDEIEKIIMQKIESPAVDNYVKVMYIRTLQEHNPKKLKNQLKKLQNSASEELINLGINIMDPRICTSLPSVKKSLTELIDSI